jgi:hypothetical protein
MSSGNIGVECPQGFLVDNAQEIPLASQKTRGSATLKLEVCYSDGGKQIAQRSSPSN